MFSVFYVRIDRNSVHRYDEHSKQRFLDQFHQ